MQMLPPRLPKRGDVLIHVLTGEALAFFERWNHAMLHSDLVTVLCHRAAIGEGVVVMWRHLRQAMPSEVRAFWRDWRSRQMRTDVSAFWASFR